MNKAKDPITTTIGAVVALLSTMIPMLLRTIGVELTEENVVTIVQTIGGLGGVAFIFLGGDRSKTDVERAARTGRTT